MIIKNADVRLMVKDTDVAIDRATQIVGDSGWIHRQFACLVSGLLWQQPEVCHPSRSACLWLSSSACSPACAGLPSVWWMKPLQVDDVTDQYVDLQSQLINLEATRERIK